MVGQRKRLGTRAKHIRNAARPFFSNGAPVQQMDHQLLGHLVVEALQPLLHLFL